MIELFIVCLLGLAGLVFSGLEARWLATPATSASQVYDLIGTVGVGVERFLKRQATANLLMAGVLGAAAFLLFGVGYQFDGVPRGEARQLGMFVTGGFIAGAGAALFIARAAGRVFHHALAATAAATKDSIDTALQIALRAGGAVTALAGGLASLGLGGLCIVAMAYWGAGPAAHRNLKQLPFLAAGMVLGGTFVAFATQLGGGTFSKLADLGASLSESTSDTGAQSSPPLPARMADLVGDLAGRAPARATSVFAVLLLDALVGMLAASLVYQHNEALSSATAVVVFPLVARSFGVVGACFGVRIVRTDDAELPVAALRRGLYVAALLVVLGGVGAAKWLLPDHWTHFGGCIAVGAVASLVLFEIVSQAVSPRNRGVRGLAETARSGSAMAFLGGVVRGVEASTIQATVALVGAFAAYRIGGATGLAGGGLLGITLGTCGFGAALHYAAALDGMASVADANTGLLDISLGDQRPDVRARGRVLDTLGTGVKVFVDATITVASGLAAVAGAMGAMAAISAQAPPASGGLFSGVTLGLALVSVFVAVSLRRFIMAAGDCLSTLRARVAVQVAADQTVGSSDHDPPIVVAHTAEDAERAHAAFESLTRASLRAVLVPALVGVGGGILCGAVLRLVSDGDSISDTAAALVVLLVTAVAATTQISLFACNAGGAWDNSKKYLETGVQGSGSRDQPRERASALLAAAQSDTLGDPLRGAVAPAAVGLVRVLVALFVVFVPFFLN